MAWINLRNKWHASGAWDIEPRFLPGDDTAIVVEFGDAIDRKTSEKIHQLGECIREAFLPGVYGIVRPFGLPTREYFMLNSATKAQIVIVYWVQSSRPRPWPLV